jgi:hypothetical protein
MAEAHCYGKQHDAMAGSEWLEYNADTPYQVKCDGETSSRY